LKLGDPLVALIGSTPYAFEGGRTGIRPESLDIFRSWNAPDDRARCALDFLFRRQRLQPSNRRIGILLRQRARITIVRN
jgi:hypothetical protein